MPVRAPTERQKKLINGIIANSLDLEKTKSARQLLREAGYSQSSIEQSNKVTNSPAVVSAVEKTIKRFQKVRDQAIMLALKKASKAPYNHLVDSVDKMQKNMNLLGGHATDNVAVKIEISEAVANKNT